MSRKVRDKKIAPTKYVTRTVSSGASESETSDQFIPILPIKEVYIPQVLSPPSSVMWLLLEPGDLARRHSLSLLNRTPPPGSLSAELLSIPGPLTKKASTNQVTLAAVKDIMESLSDFNSCRSYPSSSDSSDLEKKPSVKGSKKRRKRKKSSEKEELKKKVNMNKSPENRVLKN